MECKDFEPSIIQENRVLRLCKRLDKFTLDEISTIAEDVDEAVLELLLLTLVQEGKLTLRNDLYFYNKQSFNKKYSILSYYPAKILDIVIRCFCLSIPAYKAKDVIGIAESSTMQLYYIFRELIYERQTNKLKSLYDKSQQQGRNRIFYDEEFSFYVYDNQVFVSEKLFQSREEKIFTKSEIQEFKKVYSYLTRFTSHNSNKVDLPQKLAEGIWRRNKEFDELYADLKVNLFNIS